MHRRLYLVIFLSLHVLALNAQKVSIAEEGINYLASDKLEGRFPGTEGDSLSIKYIAGEFDTYGVKPFDFGYEQNFEVLTKIAPGHDTYAKLNDNEMVLGEMFMPMTFSAEASYQAGLHVCMTDQLSDSLDLNGEWLVLLKRAGDDLPGYRDIVNLALSAKDAGAGGLVFLAENDDNGDARFYPFRYSRSLASVDIPVIQIAANQFFEILNPAGYDLQNQDKLNQTIQAFNRDADLMLDAGVSIDKFYSTTANLAGYVEGKDTSRWLVLGAHYDHLGYGGHGSGSRTPDLHEIHNGADDNASGVAMVLMLAEYFTGHQPDMNIAFALFGAEEEGLVGSSFFVEHMPFKPDQVKAMINYDMVGRVEDSAMSISGVSTAVEFDSILTAFDKKPLHLTLGGGGYAGSDQASFYSEGIPVLFFNSGLHDDYHKPTDDASKINYDGMEMTASLSIRLIDVLDNPSTILTYQEEKSRKKSRHGGGMKVTLGIMPDVAGKTENGMGIDGVRPGGHADKAGLEKGDVIVKINDNDISGIYEYMKVMSEFKKGDSISITVLRDEKKQTFEVTF
jgi:Iap family predicted aminopeptidase